MERNQKIIQFIREVFDEKENFIPLHAPYFGGNEKKYLNETIDSTYVSSVGAFVDLFEQKMCEYTGAKYAVACVNGTNALHIALLLSGIQPDDEILSQALTFIATTNAISYIGAKPVFIDVDADTMGMSATALSQFLENNAERKADGFTYNKKTGKKISACVPMHTFGLPCRIDEIQNICSQWNIAVVEDAAESLGSYYKGKHTGTFGQLGVFSFNGNKTITCGGGGAIITNDEEIAKKAKHITTQAKIPHPWKFMHDEIGYNYRMPNLNAALACAQLEQIDDFILSKRKTAKQYQEYFEHSDVKFMAETENSKANYWLNAVLFPDENERDLFLEQSNAQKVMTRPIWELMTSLPMFKNCEHDGLKNSRYLAERIVNLPSSVRK